MNKQVINAYYVLLSAISLGMVLFTIFTGSQAVSYGQKIAALDKNKQVLISEQTQLQFQINQQVSLSAAQQLADANGYIVTTQLIQMPAQTQVALR